MYLKKEQCKERVLYRIRSRNLLFGVYKADTAGFIGVREKFDHLYPFEEYHWDNGPPFGTVHPIEALPEVLPDDIILAENLPGSWCPACKKAVNFDMSRQEGQRWLHDETSECNGPNGSIYGCIYENSALLKWLRVMEEKYYTGG